MKIYLAARYSRREELCCYREQLRALGHKVTSRWLDGMHQIDAKGNPIGEEGESLVETDEHGDIKDAMAAALLRQRFAHEDVADVQSSRLLIAFTEPPRELSRNRGGRHVELGIALGQGIPVFIVGYRENVFCWLDQVEYFETWEVCFERLGGGQQPEGMREAMIRWAARAEKAEGEVSRLKRSILEHVADLKKLREEERVIGSSIGAPLAGKAYERSLASAEGLAEVTGARREG